MPRASCYHARRARRVCVECPRIPDGGNVRCARCLAIRAAKKAQIRAARKR